MMSELMFVMEDNNLCIGQLDASKAIQLGLILPPDEFSELSGLFEGAQLTFGMDALTNIGKTIKAGSDLSISVDWEQRDGEFTISGHGTTTYTPPLLKSEQNFKQVRCDNPSIEMIVDSSTIKNTVKNLSDIGIHSIFEGTQDKFQITAKSQILGGGEFEISSDNEAVKKYDFKKDGRVMLSNQILDDISDIFKLSDTTTIKMKTDSPVEFSTRIGETGEIWFICAPRVERK